MRLPLSTLITVLVALPSCSINLSESEEARSQRSNSSSDLSESNVQEDASKEIVPSGESTSSKGASPIGSSDSNVLLLPICAVHLNKLKELSGQINALPGQFCHSDQDCSHVTDYRRYELQSRPCADIHDIPVASTVSASSQFIEYNELQTEFKKVCERKIIAQKSVACFRAPTEPIGAYCERATRRCKIRYSGPEQLHPNQE